VAAALRRVPVAPAVAAPGPGARGHRTEVRARAELGVPRMRPGGRPGGDQGRPRGPAGPRGRRRLPGGAAFAILRPAPL